MNNHTVVSYVWRTAGQNGFPCAWPFFFSPKPSIPLVGGQVLKANTPSFRNDSPLAGEERIVRICILIVLGSSFSVTCGKKAVS